MARQINVTNETNYGTNEARQDIKEARTYNEGVEGVKTTRQEDIGLESGFQAKTLRDRLFNQYFKSLRVSKSIVYLSVYAFI